MDPFLIIRHIMRMTTKGVKGIFRNGSRVLRSGAKSTWRRASRTASVPGKILLYLVSAIMGLGGGILAIPVEILGGSAKKK